MTVTTGGRVKNKINRSSKLLTKEDATVSGYDSQSSLRHVHCPKCGKIIAYTE